MKITEENTNSRIGRKFKDKVEIWKDIPLYEGRYQASNMGRIKSLEHTSNGKSYNTSFKSKFKEKILNTYSSDESKSSFVILNKKTFSIPKIIATLFIPNPNNYPLAIHRTNNWKNNKATNIIWASYNKATIKRLKIHKRKHPKGSLNPASKLQEDDVINIRKLSNEGISLCKLSKKYGVCKTTISRIINKLTWKNI